MIAELVITAILSVSASPAVVDDLPLRYRKWIDEEVVYIISDKERRIFFQLTSDAQRDRFIEEFWEQRDPSPGTDKNEFKDEHYSRIEYANKWLGRETRKPGWKTDMGRMHILLGAPKDVRRYYDSQHLVPLEMWFYEADPRLGVPPFFYCIFFKKFGVGDYILYDPAMHGPEALIFLSAGESFEQATQKIFLVDPELAQASINLVPTEMADIETTVRPTLSSIQLTSQIENIPNYQRSADYAERILRGEPRVETRYAFDSSNMPSAFHVLKLAGGDSLLSYSFYFPAAKLDYGQYQDSVYTALEVLLSVLTEDGKTVVNRRTQLDKEFSPEEQQKLRRGGIAFEDHFLLLPGRYRVSLAVRNKITKVFYTAQANVEVPSFRARKLLVTDPVLFSKTEDFGNIGPNAVPPYSYGGLKFHPLLEEAIPQGQQVGVLYQVHAPIGVSGENAAEEVKVTYSLKNDEGALIKETSDTLLASGFDNLGTATVFWKLLTGDLPQGTYKIEIVATLGEESSKAASCSVTVRNQGLMDAPFYNYSRSINFNSPQPTLEKAQQLINLGEDELAVTLLSTAFEHWPADTALGSLYAEALANSGKRDEAIDVLLQIYLREPNEPEWKRRLGMLYLQTGKFKKAISFYENLRLQEGDSVEVLNPLGEAYRFSGEVDKAREIWERSLAIEPDQPRISRQLESLEKTSPEPN
jgi:GWxTD domain-containing protein